MFYSIVFYTVYLYGHASEREYRKAVPQIRAGEYEGLEEKVSRNFSILVCVILSLCYKSEVGGLKHFYDFILHYKFYVVMNRAC